MAETLLQDPPQTRSNIGEQVTGVVAQGANIMGGKDKDMYYNVGSTVTNEYVDKTKLFSNIKNSDTIQNIRTSNADKIARFNEGSRGIDAFFGRQKDRIVKGAKDAFYWSRQKITGKKAPVTATTATTDTAEALEGAGGKVAATLGEDGKPILNAVENAAPKEIGMFGKTASVLGKVATVVAIPLTLVMGFFQVKKSTKQYDGHGAAKATGNTVGGLAGGFAAGAFEGLVLGGIMGLEVPIVGSIVLGLGGAIIGGWLGAKAANKTVGDKWQANLDKKRTRDEMLKRASVGRSAEPPQEAHYEQNGADLPAGYHASRVRAEQEAAMNADHSLAHS